jgi:large subunit ribosomal protein L29
MKPSEIRELGLEEKLRKAKDLKEELFNLRFQHEIGQLENPQKMKQIKREIARVRTIINESGLNQKTGQE